MPTAPRRIDLHCHSDASNKTSEAVLNALHCPESYSGPEEVYKQARLRGMDFVTLTDHDTIEGALSLSHKPDVLIGEELTCWFPEDNCKMHVLVYGIDASVHQQLQRRAKNIYDVAEFIEQNQIAHSVAHPIYRQNDKLERWHLERLLLLFKGFECLNGAHSSLHREAFEPMLEALSPQEISRLAETHGLTPRWPQPWSKARTAGSDDHGLLNVGRTWTEFPPNTVTPADVLKCLREGICQPGGESGSSAKLAHTFYSVAVRYYTRHIMTPGQKPNLATTLLQTLAGETPPPSKSALLKLGVKHRLKKITKRVMHPFRPANDPREGTTRLKNRFLHSAVDEFKSRPELLAAMQRGLPAFGEHSAMFDLVSKVNADVTRDLADAIQQSVDRASFVGLFDSIGALLAQQFVLLPYYFAVFHQNKERHLLREITRRQTPKRLDTLRVGLFTDTYDEANGVGRFLRDLGRVSHSRGHQLTIHTCCESPASNEPYRRNFVPLLSRPMPYYESLRATLPPLLDVLEWSDRQQFDVIHVSTPGPMGLCGWLAAQMLRVPLVATYHTDFPAYLERLAGDHRVVNATNQYMKWFYGQAAAVLTRSAAYRFNLRDLNVADDRIAQLPAGIDLNLFNPVRAAVQRSVSSNDRKTLLYCGRISVEKNLPLLVDTFKLLYQRRSDVTLVLAGEGPYLETVRTQLLGLPVEFLGLQNDAQLRTLYRTSDLLIFPSRTDTLGQAVMEAQACGLPALVSNEGGPKETVEHNHTGLVLASQQPHIWSCAIDDLLNDEPRRQRMSHAASARMSRFGFDRSADAFWQEHLNRVEPPPKPAVEVQIKSAALKTVTEL